MSSCGSIGRTTAHTPSDIQRHESAGARWRSYSVEELLARDKASLDIFWLKDDSLSDSDNLPPPGDIAAEIIEDLQSALDQLKELEADLQSNTNS
jgi:type I restriction enzyme M protein